MKGFIYISLFLALASFLVAYLVNIILLRHRRTVKKTAIWLGVFFYVVFFVLSVVYSL